MPLSENARVCLLKEVVYRFFLPIDLETLLASTKPNELHLDQTEQQVNNGPKKKKKQKVPTPSQNISDSIPPVDHGELCHSVLIDRFTDQRTTSDLFPLSLVDDIGILSILSSHELDSDHAKRNRRWLPVLERCINSIESTMRSALNEPTLPSSCQMITRLGGIMPIIIRKSLERIGHSLAEEERENIFVRSISEQFLQPLIKALCVISHTWAFVQLTQESPAPSSRSDIRPFILGIFKQTTDALKMDTQLHRYLSALTLVYAIRQLEEEWTSMREIPTLFETAEYHAHYLGFKDSVWYLVAVAQASVSTKTTASIFPAHESPAMSGVICRVVDSVTEILQQNEETRIMGVSERRMLLGLIERAWMSGTLPEASERSDNSERHSTLG
ncbi:hypothetical protein FRC17_001164 [Serendipita sp. 399]|nr:hypothetical protein FRC17_001164 [Serendipita sp. 399]